ncbi:hypothetical protein H696_03602 [Fonticula alba]|uniref:Upf1 domain-containing protein n=1 Tax=Fonticula alba TaxID=691883 RepID=A0A058Z894_FONAL|nr:hypothetical protein H696_03602 [Fonticula alba]KCV70143.1 hypothetical protein H696_03602 [Fonticula alba]|eukprot:XP_009495749.1 hypothetical protein H696_03602 [Fonticula alba]
MTNAAIDYLSADFDEMSLADYDHSIETIEDTPDEAKQLPAWACSFCENHDPMCMAKCEDCSRWFCNMRLSTNHPSHIISHMVLSRHKTVRLHPENSLGDCLIECYDCGASNAFLIGYVLSTDHTSMKLLCRYRCQNKVDQNFDRTSWEPVVHDSIFRSWLINSPKPSERPELTLPKLAQVNQLNNSFNTDHLSSQSIALVNSLNSDEKLAPVPEVFESAEHYRDIFVPLVELEQAHSVMLSATEFETNVSATLQPEGDSYIFLTSASHLRVSSGCFLSISHPDCGDLVLSATIIHISHHLDQKIKLSLQMVTPEHRPLFKRESGFTVKLSENPIHFLRILKALKAFPSTKAIDPVIVKCLLGIDVDGELPVGFRPFNMPADFCAPNINKPNHSQRQVMMSTVSQPFSLIQGPPGTGKTTTIANLVYFLKSQGLSILLSAPSNVAVSNICGQVAATGLDVLWMESESREFITSPNKHLTFLEKAMKRSPRAREIIMQRRNNSHLTDERNNNADREFIVRMRHRLVNEAKIVAATLSSSANIDRQFDVLIVDEATQSTDPEILVALMHNPMMVILVGDHCQLGPVVMSTRTMNAGLNRSLFERLVLHGSKPLRLNTQYRMHPCLSDFPSASFYEGSLSNGVNELQRNRPDVKFPWPNPDKPMMMYSDNGTEDLSPSGQSYINDSEARQVLLVLNRLLDQGILPEQIGVISPYDGQCRHIRYVLATFGAFPEEVYNKVDVASVDSFQGSEREYIILSTTRTRTVGFLADTRRLNVSITRARCGLIIICNTNLLRRNHIWRYLIEHYSHQGLLVSGNLDSLVPIQVKTRSRTQRMSNSSPTAISSSTVAQLLDESLKSASTDTNLGSSPAVAYQKEEIDYLMAEFERSG